MASRRVSTIHDRRYRALVESLVALRKQAGLPQSAVASALRCSQSEVSKIERCERRLDVIELADYVSCVTPRHAESTLRRLLRSALAG